MSERRCWKRSFTVRIAPNGTRGIREGVDGYIFEGGKIGVSNETRVPGTQAVTRGSGGKRGGTKYFTGGRRSGHDCARHHFFLSTKHFFL